MNSDAPYESAVRTSLIPLHGRKSWGQFSSNNKTLNGVITDAITRNGAAAEIFCARLQSF
jgi:hypothetical protein